MLSVEQPGLFLEQLFNVTQKMGNERDLDRQLQLVVDAARRFASAEGGAVYLLDKTKRFLLPKVKQGKMFSSKSMTWNPIPLETGSQGRFSDVRAYCALTGQLVNIADIYQYTGFDFSEFYDNDKLLGTRTRSLLAIPLSGSETGSNGVLLLFNCVENGEGETESFSTHIEPLIRGFASIASISISNNQLINTNEVLLKQQEELNQTLIIENKELKGRLFKSLMLDDVIGRSEAMKKVFMLIEKVANSTATVLLNGETGTGKELIAATIHRNSPVRTGQFVAQNCAAFPPDLLESEMFGYRKGAFSGATNNKKGLFEVANNGTLFLDEIGEMPLELQSKLLRVLQEGEIRPIGGVDTIKVNVRVIAATNRMLDKEVSEGRFREDLYYRLNVFPIKLPPLRERKEDLPALINYFIDKYSKQYDKEIKRIDSAAMDLLHRYPFPGNVRELQNIIERAVIMVGKGNVFDMQCLSLDLGENSDGQFTEDDFLNACDSLKDKVSAYEAKLLKDALEANHGNQSLTAKQLGLSRRTLVDKLSKHKLRRMDTFSME
ncbi:sigma-54-dependent Fis family transcriptional regulator [Aestuariibacter salexigens]|uniref:sigma-54-dependent Fis family transcriptional regulator n=1 Tax=Aestuariibacter salexigens TaxID=226010 RepID=UPI0003F6749A|nr:sigma-54-dependent Fis family transcriptional regulator [Aestuariibacter salexigens]